MKKMRKEIAVGVITIGLLLVIFSSMLYRRLAPHGHAAGSDEPAIARKLMPIPEVPREQAPDQATLVAASEGIDPAAGSDTRGWAAREHRQVLAVEPENVADPAQDSQPSDAGDLERLAASANVLTSGREALDSPEPTPAEAPSGGDPFAHPRGAFDAPASEPVSDPVAAYTPDAENGSGYDAAGQQPVVDPATEAIATSGTEEMEQPRAGLRSRFPQGEDSRYDSADQPGHLDREAGEFSPRAQSRATVENGKYTVQPNDSYWTISEKVYGDGGYFKAIYEHNRLRYPRADKLQVGDTLDTPHSGVLAERYPELCPKQRKVPSARNTLVPASARQRIGQRVYLVAEGDTLFDIAKYELGKATRWNEIYELNRDVFGEEFDYLRPGTELVLPHERREGESVTRGRDPGMQR